MKTSLCSGSLPPFNGQRRGNRFGSGLNICSQYEHEFRSTSQILDIDFCCLSLTYFKSFLVLIFPERLHAALFRNVSHIFSRGFHGEGSHKVTS